MSDSAAPLPYIIPGALPHHVFVLRETSGGCQSGPLARIRLSNGRQTPQSTATPYPSKSWPCKYSAGDLQWSPLQRFCHAGPGAPGPGYRDLDGSRHSCRRDIRFDPECVLPGEVRSDRWRTGLHGADEYNAFANRRPLGSHTATRVCDCTGTRRWQRGGQGGQSAFGPRPERGGFLCFAD